MAIVGVFRLAVTSSKLGLTKEEMANKALPFLIPLSIENGLTVAQFTIIVNLIKEMIQKVETEHRTKLEQLHAIQDSQKSSLQASLSENMTLGPGKLVAAPSAAEVSVMDSMYSGLGLSDYINSDKSNLVNTVIGTDKVKHDNNTNTPNIPKSSSSLTLQEKKQMMQKQEPVQPPRVSASPVNLTDSLINKSMSMNAMSVPRTSSSSGTFKPSSGQTNWNTSSTISDTPTWNSPNTGFVGGLAQQSSQGFGNFAAASSSFSPSPLGMTQPKPTQSKPDLSAFDSLMSPSSLAQPKPSMGSMMGGESRRP